jgi:hypothetical protein
MDTYQHHCVVSMVFLMTSQLRERKASAETHKRKRRALRIDGATAASPSRSSVSCAAALDSTQPKLDIAKFLEMSVFRQVNQPQGVSPMAVTLRRCSCSRALRARKTPRPRRSGSLTEPARRVNRLPLGVGPGSCLLLLENRD